MQNSKDFIRKNETTMWKETTELKVRLRVELLQTIVRNDLVAKRKKKHWIINIILDDG